MQRSSGDLLPLPGRNYNPPAVTRVPVAPVLDEDVCPECAHPVGTHAATCSRSETELLRRERAEIVRLLEEFGKCDPERQLADQLRQALRQTIS